MNTTLLETYDEQADKVRDIVSNYNKVPATLSQIRKSGKNFYYGQTQVETTALKDLLNIFSIKESLVNEIKNDKDQWEPLQRCLADIKQDRTVTAVTRKNSSDERSIVRFTDSKIDEEQNLELERGIELMREYAGSQDGDNLQLHNMGFDSENLMVRAQFRNINSKVDVFNDGADIWDTGLNINFGETKSSVAPFYLRLICTNGMIGTHQMSQRYFDNSEFKHSTFTKLVSKVMDQDLTGVIRANGARLHETTASLREFYNARNILLGRSVELAKTYFDDTEIKDAYKDERLRYKNSRWLATANTNINAYDFFNRITHCTSHSELNDTTRLQLNNIASELFFKGPDFAYKAPDPFAKR
jgi:hypothetical protein